MDVWTSGIVEPGNPGLKPGNPGLEPGNPGIEPGNPGIEPGNPGIEPGNPGIELSVFGYVWPAMEPGNQSCGNTCIDLQPSIHPSV